MHYVQWVKPVRPNRYIFLKVKFSTYVGVLFKMKYFKKIKIKYMQITQNKSNKIDYLARYYRCAETTADWFKRPESDTESYGRVLHVIKLLLTTLQDTYGTYQKEEIPWNQDL